ncbi:MAG: MarR family winged helix-turn-helix transcriptional regulator [Sulfitobacter sp.]|nr:MarR family winged helix-turn-helix transcriptional regulator [Sulfitobacter sp.]
MPDDKKQPSKDGPSKPKHPPVSGLEEVITFRLQRLVTIGDRAGNHWSERLFDLTLNEWRLLALVVAYAPARASDMADLLYMDKSQISRCIKSLETKGLVKNTTDEEDRRAIALKPTTKGRKLYTKVMEEVMRSNERVLAPLSAQEVVAFNETLEKLISHNDALLRARLGSK